jgi:site-specific DNA-methyltransferase (cytosine-N4-specific)
MKTTATGTTHEPQDKGFEKKSADQLAAMPFLIEMLQYLESESRSQGFMSVSDYLTDLHITAAKSKYRRDLQAKGTLDSQSELAFKTKHGRMYCGDSHILMKRRIRDNSVDLIITSPPFGLVRKKDYGNEDADRYLAWFEQFASEFIRVLKPTGSLVIDIGGAWKQGRPVRSLYHFELVIMLCRRFGFHLAQEFYWWNPAKLPTPAEWVNVRRVRVKDAVNCVWWLSKTPYPKASNRRILHPYSESMKGLLKNGYKSKLRPSGHDISDKFQRDNGGAIPPNLIAIANTESNSSYQRYCQENGLPIHPARFPAALPGLFVQMLTNRGDLVLDPFAGSAMTGAVCEQLARRWICCELDKRYVEGARGRFATDAGKVLSGRIASYEVYPPQFTLQAEEIGLVEDGGATRSHS